MLFEKFVRLGTSFQMVKDMFRISKHNTIFIVSQCNAHPLCYVGNEASLMRNHPK